MMTTALALVMSAGACAQPVDLSAEVFPAGEIAGYVRYDMATGRAQIFRADPGLRQGPPLWMNNDWDNNGRYFHAHDGTANNDGRSQYGSLVLDWGDGAFNWRVDHFRFGYEVNPAVQGPNAANGDPTVPGLSYQIVFYDGDNGRDTFSTPLAVFRLDNLPGFDPTTGQRVWIVDVDASSRPFVLGNTLTTGRDLDGDGLADFAYGFRMIQGQNAFGIPRRPCGTLLVLPGNEGGDGNPPSIGVEDAIDWYNGFNQQTGAKTSYVDTYFFGGFPFASYWMELYGRQINPCAADFNNDGFLDFFDYIDFIDCFEGFQCPPGQDADFNLDGFPDFFDFVDFIDAFDRGC